MKSVVIITNIPSPYRVDFFFYLQNNISNYSFFIFYTNASEDNRNWQVDNKKIINTIFLKSKVIKIKQKLDVKYIHIPGNIKRELNKVNPDIIVAMEYNPAALGALSWSNKNNKRFVHWTDGTLSTETDINYIQKWSRRKIINSAHSCIASSSKAKEKLLSYGIEENKIFVSFLTVDQSKFVIKPHNKDESRLIYVGSLSFRKGLDLLVSALVNVKHDYKIDIVGSGDEKHLRELCEKNGIINKVSFKGFVEGEALIQLYSKSSLFVFPTRQDCYGLVLLEAICANLPIVCSKYADGAYDLVDNGVTGFIGDPYNAYEFAELIDQAIENSEQMKLHIKDKLEAFSFKSVSKNFIAALDFQKS